MGKNRLHYASDYMEEDGTSNMDNVWLELPTVFSCSEAIMLWVSVLEDRRRGCGTYQGVIADAQNTKLQDEVTALPWLVSVQDKYGTHLIVGAIISEWWIVTAPSGLEKRSNLMAVLKTDNSSNTAIYPIRKVIIHEKFDAIQNINDIMLLMTEQKIHFGILKQPICFPSKDPENSALSNCLLSIWNDTKISEEVTPLVNNCVDYENNPSEETGTSYVGAWDKISVVNAELCPLPRTMATECCGHHQLNIINGNVGKQGNIVSCQVTENNLWVLAGMLTSGGMMDYGPFLYTRTSFYVDWITNQTSEAKEPFHPTIIINKLEYSPTDAPEGLFELETVEARAMTRPTPLFYDYYEEEELLEQGNQIQPFTPLTWGLLAFTLLY
ncbi:inactive serine protease 54 [Discoglossus pictus]